LAQRSSLACLACSLLVVAAACTSGDDGDDASDAPAGGQSGGGGSGAGGSVAGGSGGNGASGGSGGHAENSGGAGGSTSSALPPFTADDASGITRLAGCALAKDGACVRMIDRDHDATCARFQSDYPAGGAPVFLGADAACDPGETDPQAIADALRRLNLYRWLVGLSPVTHDEAWADDARACAVIQAHIAPNISHYPEPDVDCYGEQGALASSQSNIAAGDRDPSSAMDGLLFDSGDNNAHVLGHRQLLLNPGLKKVGIGYTEVARDDLGLVDPYGSTCVQVFTADSGFDPRAAGLDGMVAYPPPGEFPYEPMTWAILGERRGEEAFDQRLQWSMSFADETDVTGASVRVYRQDGEGFEDVAADFGVLGKTTPGLWILPKAEVESGTYVVLVDGTALGAFGYRTVIEPCGPTLKTSCDVAKQDCGDDSAGCYDIDHPYCAVGKGIPLGEPCDDDKLTDCAHGGVCGYVFNGAGGTQDERRCTRYCDAEDPSSPIACDSLCPGQWAIVSDGATGIPQALATCSPGSGGTCDPLAQDCDEGRGCYGREAVTCSFAGEVPRGHECTGLGVECEPGTDCIGVMGGVPVCSPYCDPSPAAAGPRACATLCPGGNWPYNDYALCIPD
jgi:uncharacterized protein YkwD